MSPVEQLYVQAQNYRALDDRLIWAALLPPGSGPLGRASGVRSGRDLALSMATSTVGEIAPGIAAVPLGNRHYMLSNDAPLAVNFAAGPATNARIDTVIAQVYDSEVSGPDTPGAIRVLTGTVAATPAPPVLTAGMMPLYDVRYNAGSSAPALITDRRLVTVSDDRVAFETPLGGVTATAPNTRTRLRSHALPAGAWLLIAKGTLSNQIVSGGVPLLSFELVIEDGGRVIDRLTLQPAYAISTSPVNQSAFSLASRVYVPADTMVHLEVNRLSALLGMMNTDVSKIVGVPIVADPSDVVRADRRPPATTIIPDEYPRGVVGYRQGLPATVPIGTAISYPMSITVPTVAGRYYRVMNQARMNIAAASAGGTALNRWDMEPVSGTDSTIVQLNPTQRVTAANEAICVQCEGYFHATANSMRIRILAQAVGDQTLTIFAGQQYTRWVVEDVGLRPPAMLPD